MNYPNNPQDPNQQDQQNYQPPMYQYQHPPMPMQAPIMPVKKKSGIGKSIATALLCGAFGVGGAMFYDQVLSPSTAPQILYTSPSLEAQKVVSVTSYDISLPDLYTMNVNSTVGITVSTTVNVFGQPTTSAANGSGFVISSDGYIITNFHVIEDATTSNDSPVEVKFKNGDSYTATIVGYEKDNDLAVLKIEASGLTPVVMGDSDTLVVGETVVAIGNPLGELDFSFTDGIISAKDRLISTGDDVTMNMLQTNTAINPGNSGGPLFDGQGALIGINTAKYATSSDGTTVEGLGFAIPINDVKDMISDIIENGYVTGKPYLGVSVRNVPDEAQMYGIVAGASIESIAAGGAAEKAGLVVGDIVIAVDDVTVDSSSALTAALTSYRAGESAVFTVVRNHEEVKIEVTFDEKNDETVANNPLPEETTNQYNGNQSGGNGNGSNGWESFYNFPFGNFFP